MRYWLVKSEPGKYSWEKFLKDKETFWDGVRNYQARNNLREMKVNDQVLFYHSNEDKAVQGLATVVKEFYQDPTTEDANWVAVDLAPVKTLKNPVTLARIKSTDSLSQIALVRNGRLSVMPLSREEFDTIIELSE